MNEKIDVLAVMDAFAGCAMTSSAHAPLRMDEARAAVAELIEAAIGVYAACRSGKEPDLIVLADALDSGGAKDKRKAALARIGGDA